MLYNLYSFDHDVLHICFWTLPAIILGVLMIIMAIVHMRNHKKREEEFEKKMEEKINNFSFEDPEAPAPVATEA